MWQNISDLSLEPKPLACLFDLSRINPAGHVQHNPRSFPEDPPCLTWYIYNLNYHFCIEIHVTFVVFWPRESPNGRQGITGIMAAISGDVEAQVLTASRPVVAQ